MIREAGEEHGRLVAFLDRLASSGTVPGGVAVVVGAGGDVLLERAFGRAALVPVEEPATPDTLWDCASLTKPLVTASLFMLWRARGLVDFRASAADLLPELAAPGVPHRPPTIGELLVHAAGLPAWEPLYALTDGGLPARAALLGRLRSAPGVRAVYGCPGYQLLGLLAERLTGRTLSELARSDLFGDRDDLYFPLPPELAHRAAPTEEGNASEEALAGARARGYRGFRRHLIRGEAHDHNAHTLGGAAGNAGLFATGRGIASLCAAFLTPGRFRDVDLSELRCNQAPGDGELRTWGFQLARSANSPAGSALSERAFGHAGFTGTSCFVDPDRGVAHVLLTNRVHPRWTDHPFHADRRRFHELAARWIDRARDAGRG